MPLLIQKTFKNNRYKKPVPVKKILTSAIFAAFFLFFVSAVTAQTALQKKVSNEFAVAPKVCHIFQGEDGAFQLIASDNKQIIIHDKKKFLLFSYDVNSGLENWRTEISEDQLNLFSSDGKNLFFVISLLTEDKGTHHFLNSVSLITGTTNWRQKVELLSDLFVIPETNLVLTLQGDKMISAFDKSDGRPVWKKKFGKSVFFTIPATKSYLTVLSENLVHKISAESGEIIETYGFPAQFTGSIKSLAVNSKWIISGDSLGAIRKKNYTNNAIDWTFKTGGSITFLMEIERGILAVSFDNFIYLFNPENGKQKWKKRIGDRIDIKPSVFGEYAFVASSNGNTVTIIDLSEGRTVNQIRLANDAFVNREPFIFDKKLLISTTKGVFVYAFGECQ